VSKNVCLKRYVQQESQQEEILPIRKNEGKYVRGAVQRFERERRWLTVVGNGSGSGSRAESRPTELPHHLISNSHVFLTNRGKLVVALHRRQTAAHDCATTSSSNRLRTLCLGLCLYRRDGVINIYGFARQVSMSLNCCTRRN